MKLSEAISLGAMLSPQAFGYFVDAGGGRCALGAAKAAIGQSTDYSEWKWASRVVNCPACGGMLPAIYAISHLNDLHQWPRQQIAEWVYTIEPHHETASLGENGEEFATVA
jgi:hypothetical protein